MSIALPRQAMNSAWWPFPQSARGSPQLGVGGGLFVGSGAVKASCKTIGQRLYQSGMHWTATGADTIIALRCKEASSTWEAICSTPHTQTRTA